MSERGVIRNREHASQINDFSGLRWGSITPTDVDGMVEFGGKLFVFMECKYGGTGIGKGQRLALMRTAAAVHDPPNHYAAIIWGQHDTPPDEDIDYASMRVAGCWWPGESRPSVRGAYGPDMSTLDKYWHDGSKTVKEVIDSLRAYTEKR